MHLYYFIAWLGQTLAFWLNIALAIAYFKLYRLIANTKFSVHRRWMVWVMASFVVPALTPLLESLLFHLRIISMSAVHEMFVYLFMISVLLGAYSSYVLIRVMGEIIASPPIEMGGAPVSFD